VYSPINLVLYLFIFYCNVCLIWFPKQSKTAIDIYPWWVVRTRSSFWTTLEQRVLEGMYLIICGSLLGLYSQMSICTYDRWSNPRSLWVWITYAVDMIVCTDSGRVLFLFFCVILAYFCCAEFLYAQQTGALHMGFYMSISLSMYFIEVSGYYLWGHCTQNIMS
jgi:hypothetical protein